MYQRNETQAQNFQLEYQSILAELKRQLAVCQRILKLPNAPIPNYPSPVSVKTPSFSRTGEGRNRVLFRQI